MKRRQENGSGGISEPSRGICSMNKLTLKLTLAFFLFAFALSHFSDANRALGQTGQQGGAQLQNTAAGLTHNYYFNWYDGVTAGLRGWLVIGNPGSESIHANVYIGGALKGSYDLKPGQRITPAFTGVMKGPVKIAASGVIVASEWSIYNNNVFALPATPQEALTSDSYLNWYDQRTPGTNSWILVSNQGSQTAAVDISIGAQLVGRYSLAPGASITPQFAGLMDGPVRVTATNGQPLAVSERTLDSGALNETDSSPNPAAAAAARTTSSPGAWPDASGHYINALIVHDQQNDPELPRELDALLGHFPVRADIVYQDDYQPGLINNYDAVFYIGGSHRTIPPAFLNDVYSTEKTVVWIGRGLDQLGQAHPLGKYGIAYLRVDASGTLDLVSYKGQALPRTSPVDSIVKVVNGGRASVLAWMEGKGQQDEPYALHSGNFWFFADIPMEGVDKNSTYSADGASDNSAYLVLADLLYDILGQNAPPSHQAMIRIEDIHPNTDPSRLANVVDYLYHKGIPFGIALVPVYVNPATNTVVHLSERPDLVKVLKDAQAKGGTIIEHGYTHQYKGETVVDYEFWDRDTHAPPAGETPAWVAGRIDSGLAELKKVGITPDIWETPHYAASEMAHDVISTRFGIVWERRDAPFFPYPVRLPTTGELDLPETLGYIDPGEGLTADKLLKEAAQQKVVRSGSAAFFFHPSQPGSQLRQMIEGLQDQGYTFVSPAQVAGLGYRPPAPPSWINNLAWQVSDKLGEFMPANLFSPEPLALIALFIITYYWGMFLLSRKPAPARGPYDPNLAFFIIIPALNEELVLGKTLQHLLKLADKNLTILVVNDGSDDGTREVALSFPHNRVKLIDHPHDLARQGKGKVLNYAFRYLIASDIVREKGPENVIMGVLDADGRVETNIVKSVNSYFADPKAGAVQVGVRISNATTNVLTKWQNFEFLTFARISQKAREHLGSVGLGGNGQFVRLSALASLGNAPWTDCLTEDLDLGIRLMLSGWNNHYCPNSFVAQQGIPNLRPLVRQRTRWFQGHVTCWRHIPALLARTGSIFARSDTIYYLLAPIMVFLFLPGSLLFLAWSAYFLISGAGAAVLTPWNYIPALVLWYLFSFGALPTVVWTFWREDKEMSAFRAFLWAHVFAFFYIIWFAAACKAIYRLARGQGQWAKTARVEEPGTA